MSVDPKKDGKSYLCRSCIYDLNPDGEDDPNGKRKESFYELKPNQAYRIGHHAYHGSFATFTPSSEVTPTLLEAWELDPEDNERYTGGSYVQYSIHTPRMVKPFKHDTAFITNARTDVEYEEKIPKPTTGNSSETRSITPDGSRTMTDSQVIPVAVSLSTPSERPPLPDSRRPIRPPLTLLSSPLSRQASVPSTTDRGSNNPSQRQDRSRGPSLSREALSFLDSVMKRRDRSTTR